MNASAAEMPYSVADAELIDHIRTRRAELVAQFDGARLQYADLEETIEQQQESLALLQRHLDAMHGGLQELDALLVALENDAR